MRLVTAGYGGTVALLVTRGFTPGTAAVGPFTAISAFRGYSAVATDRRYSATAADRRYTAKVG